MCEGLVLYLPQLWDASADHNMLRCAILTTLVVVQGLGSACENISPFVYCVIKLSVDSKNEESVYLLEEGLELWLATLHNSKTLLPQWMELTRFMPPILGSICRFARRRCSAYTKSCRFGFESRPA